MGHNSYNPYKPGGTSKKKNKKKSDKSDKKLAIYLLSPLIGMIYKAKFVPVFDFAMS